MEPYIGEIRMFAGNFPPRGWAMCNGQLMAISQNTALFSILGVNYGGDGKTTFALPNLQGTTPIQAGQGPGLTDYVIGENSGTPNYTLISTEMPKHNHTVQVLSTSGDLSDATSHILANSTTPDLTGTPVYITGATPNVTLNPMAITISGGSLPHNNMQPYLCVSFIIALEGVFPTRG